MQNRLRGDVLESCCVNVARLKWEGRGSRVMLVVMMCQTGGAQQCAEKTFCRKPRK